MFLFQNTESCGYSCFFLDYNSIFLDPYTNSMSSFDMKFICLCDAATLRAIMRLSFPTNRTCIKSHESLVVSRNTSLRVNTCEKAKARVQRSSQFAVSPQPTAVIATSRSVCCVVIKHIACNAFDRTAWFTNSTWRHIVTIVSVCGRGRKLGWNHCWRQRCVRLFVCFSITKSVCSSRSAPGFTAVGCAGASAVRFEPTWPP